MRIVDPETREERPERHVGELLIRGTSVTPGYYKRPDATAALFHGGWLCTGDLGLHARRRAGAVRADQGRDHRRRPQRVPRGHRARGRRPRRVRAGNVIAFGVEGYKGKETVVVVAERAPSRRRARAIRERHPPPHARGVRPAARDVMLVQPGTLPKTSSGKLQRAKCREQYLNETLELGAERASTRARELSQLGDPGLRLGPPPAARSRAGARVVGVPAAVRAPRAGRGDPRRARPPTTRFTFAEPATAAPRRSRPCTTPGWCASSRRRGTSTSARSDRPTTWCPTCSRWPALREGMGPAPSPAASAPGSAGGASRRRRRSPRARTRRPARRSTARCAAPTRARRRARRLRAVPPAWAPRHDVAVRRLLLLQQRGHRRRPRARRPARRSPCSTSTTTTATARSRSSTSATTCTFVSLHGDPARAYPYLTGHADETGAGRGSGATLQRAAAGRHRRRRLPRRARAGARRGRRRPTRRWSIVSLGVDTFVGDPMCDLALTTEGFGRMRRRRRRPRPAARRAAGGRLRRRRARRQRQLVAAGRDGAMTATSRRERSRW